jgi:hypothetical protein
MWGGLANNWNFGQALVARRVCKGQETDQLVLLFFAHLLGGIVLALGKSIMVGWEIF